MRPRQPARDPPTTGRAGVEASTHFSPSAAAPQTSADQQSDRESGAASQKMMCPPEPAAAIACPPGANRTPFQCLPGVGQRHSFLTGGRVPEPHSAVTARGGGNPARRRERHSRHDVRVAAHRSNTLPAETIPQGDRHGAQDRARNNFRRALEAIAEPRAAHEPRLAREPRRQIRWAPGLPSSTTNEAIVSTRASRLVTFCSPRKSARARSRVRSTRT